jgi:hypothetical protein
VGPAWSTAIDAARACHSAIEGGRWLEISARAEIRNETPSGPSLPSRAPMASIQCNAVMRFWRGDVPGVQAALQAGVDPDLRGGNGCTALMLAAQKGHVAVVGALVGGGAAVGAVDGRGWTALHLAAEYGHAALVEALAGAGASVDAVTKSGDTPLSLAAYYGKTEAAAALLGAGADATRPTRQGKTAAEWAPLYRGAALAAQLIEGHLSLGHAQRRLCLASAVHARLGSGSIIWAQAVCCDVLQAIAQRIAVVERSVPTSAHCIQTSEGWLSKLGEVNRSFQRRWFVLRDGQLRYFDAPGGAEKGVVAMSDCSTAVAHRDSAAAAFTLLLASKGCMYVLQASSFAEQGRWIQALQGSIKAYAHGADPIPSQRCRSQAITVVPGPPVIRYTGSNRHIAFEFLMMMDGAVLWRLRGRYSKLRMIHDTLCKEAQAGSLLRRYRQPLPNFPAKTSFLTDDTAITSIQQRLVGLQTYFQAVVTHDEGGHVLCSPLAREQLQVPPGAAVAVDAIGQRRAAAWQAAAPELHADVQADVAGASEAAVPA